MPENESALRERLARLSEASRRINESLDFDAVIQGVLDSARSLTGARYGVMTLVDDDPRELRYVQDTLIAAGYAPVVTGDPEETLRLVAEERPALVLLDLILPGADGIELMKEILDVADVPVIFLSAYGRAELIATAFGMGAVDYVVKPFSPTELTARIAAALRRREVPETLEPYVLGDLTIDYAGRRVTLAGRPVPLLPMEYRMLVELSAGAGRVLTYEHLIQLCKSFGLGGGLLRGRAARRTTPAIRSMMLDAPARRDNHPAVHYPAYPPTRNREGATVHAENLPAARGMSYAEFLDWCNEDTLAEWVDGEVIMASPASAVHQILVGFLLKVLDTYAEQHELGQVIAAPFQMKTGPELPGREPDLLFIARENLDRLEGVYLDGPADLAIEVVSPASRLRDRGEKLAEYEMGGVREYWVIDSEEQRADFYVLAADGRYERRRTGEDGVYPSEVITGFRLRESWLWQQPLPKALSALRELGVV